MLAFDALSSCLSSNIRRIQVKRDSILEDLFKLYESEEVVQDYLQVNFVREEGLDTGGLLKDMFSSFWIEAFKKYFTGENVFVPFLPISRQHEANKIYPLLGRILSHSAALLNNVPVCLCRSTLLTITHSPTKAEDECVLQDFLNFVTGSERRILVKALKNYQSLNDSDREEVRFIFGRFGMGAILREENIISMMVNLARQELCTKPLFLCTLIKSGIPKNHQQAFWDNLSTAEVNELYKALLPTNNGVLSLLQTEDDLRPEEDVVFYYLRDFVRGLGNEDLMLFLRFVTGQDLMPKGQIRVMFSRMEGISRRPIAHTCSNLLELSLCYETIQEFSREFKAVLRDPTSYTMDII